MTQDVTAILVLPLGRIYPRFMRKKCILRSLLLASLLVTQSGAATKVHVIVFGKWMSVQWTPDSTSKPLPLKVRALVVDGRVREYAVGPTHEVTERLFVVQRALRVNDSLPEDSSVRWQWQRSGWILVDRLTGRISTVNLPAQEGLRDCGATESAQACYEKTVVGRRFRRGPARFRLPRASLAAQSCSRQFRGKRRGKADVRYSGRCGGCGHEF